METTCGQASEFQMETPLLGTGFASFLEGYFQLLDSRVVASQYLLYISIGPAPECKDK